MKRLVLFASCFAAQGCFEFDGLLRRCEVGEAPCDGSSAGGGGATGGGSGGGISDGGDAPVCLNGFCWENPLPQGNDLTAVWGSSPDDVWMGGLGYTLLRWNGALWRSYQLPPQDEPMARVNALFAGGGDVYAGRSPGALMKWSGTQWLPATGAPAGVTALTGSGAVDLWAGTAAGDVVHFDGMMWSTRVPGGGNAVGTMAVDGASGVFWDEGVGPQSFAFHHYAPATVVTTFSTAVAGAWPQTGGVLRVTLVDATDHQLRPDGGLSDSGNTGIATRRTHVLPDGAGFAVGGALGVSRIDGGAWEPLVVVAPSGYGALSLEAVWTAPAQVGSWAVGSGGVMARYDATGFTVRSSGVVDSFEAIAERDGTFVGIGRDGFVKLRDPATGRWARWQPVTGGDDLYAMCALADGGFALGGHSGHVFFWRDLTASLPASAPLPVDQPVTGLVCLPGGVVFASTLDGHVARYDGAGWQIELSGGGVFNALDGYDESHLWAAGPNVVYARRRDAGWEPTPVVGTDLYAAKADPDAGCVWLGGARNRAEQIICLDLNDGGTTDTSLVSPHSDGIILTLAGGGPDLWAAGERGALFHWSGSRWLSVETGSRQAALDLLVRARPDGGGDLWVAGSRGSVLHSSY